MTSDLESRMVEFQETFSYKLIYILSIEDKQHEGLLKIGDATVKGSVSCDELVPNCKLLNDAAKTRINGYTTTAGIEYMLLHTELAVRKIKKAGNKYELKTFRDHDVHEVLENSGIEKHEFETSKGREWFKTNLATAIQGIEAVKNGRPNISQTKLAAAKTQIIFRPEQAQAIKDTIEVYKTKDTMLWNAKMRFGKTLCALEVIKKKKFKKSIILTHRPVVNAGWYEDFKKIFFDDANYEYGSKVNGQKLVTLLESKKNFVFFASIQDLRGSSKVGGKFNKNDKVFNTDWDFVVVDEAHEGTTTALGNEVIKNVVKKDRGSKTKFLALSGTAFNIINKYDTDNVFTWDYVMEQKSKLDWDVLHFGDFNPYESLPQLKIYTYDIGKIFASEYYQELEDKAFNFKEFFRVWTGDIKRDKKPVPSGSKAGDFYHAEDVTSFLNLITKSDTDSNYPYATSEYRALFKHTLWMVPGVLEARALSKMLKAHPIFGDRSFKIVNVAGPGDEEEKAEDALKKVREAIDKAGDGYTITISCGKLTTGVTVPEWTAVFMLAGSFSTSASSYLQTIFRVQSPCSKNGKVKQCCYVFDFAPDRTLKMVAESAALSTKAGKAKESDKRIMGELLNYCPIISVSGTKMKTYNVDKLLQQLKRAYAERVVKNGFDDAHLYNDELLKLDSAALEAFGKLRKIVGKSKAAHQTKEVEINDQGFTEEEHEILEKKQEKGKKLSPEELAKLEEIKKKRKEREAAISILRGISIRIPLLIYGADFSYDEDFTVKDLLNDKIIDKASWKEFMPKDVTKKLFKNFIKYYDQDIFIAAGRKIRNITMAADTLPPTERVEKITNLFNDFKNPDKETVLTPWRAVNMHMSSSLGGYDFYDINHEELLTEPREVNNGKITDDTLGNINAHILEINSKTGLYPLYVTYSIFRKKCSEFMETDLTLEKKEQIWNETVQNNVFIICKTPMAKMITKRTLLGYKQYSVNAHYFDDIVNMLKNKPSKFVKKVLRGSYWNHEETKKMKFDAVVGNPPYQESMKNTSDSPVYHLFMNSAMELSDIVSFITPARFLFNAGKTPKEWNNKMLNDKHFKVIYYTPDSTDVFPNVDIKGGVAITLIDKGASFEKIGVFSAYKELDAILGKVEKKNEGALSNMVYAPESYSFTANLHSENPWVNEHLSKGHKFDITTNIFEKIPKLFYDTKLSDDYVGILGRENNQRVCKWIKKDYVAEHDNLFCYKVILPKSNGKGTFGEVLSTPMIAGPAIGHTQTFISIGAFDTEFEATSLLKYIKTKFVRCMLGILKATQDNKKSVWKYVPIQDFTNKSDIDWNKSISEIDEQLFKKYDLSAEDISFINNKVQVMK